MKNSFWLSFLVCMLLITSGWGQQRVKRSAEIKYISHQSYYINLGSKHGLKVGDEVSVKRNNRTVATLLVENVANLSSACKLLNQIETIKPGYKVEVLVEIENPQPQIEEPEIPRQKTTGSRFTRRSNQPSQRKEKSEINRVRGRFSVQSIWSNDQSSSNLDYKQLGLRGNLTVEKILGTPFGLRFRWRSRAYHRDRVVSSVVNENELTHNVYELGVVYQNGISPFEFGFGRILWQQIRGLGYIDGGLFSFKMNGQFRVGLAGGTQPSLQNSAFQTSEQKFGFFLNFEKGEYRTQRLSSTAAFSGSYHSGKNSREFVYLQNHFSAGSKFSVYQTVEIDFNRGWKNAYSKNKLQFSNFFISTNYSPLEFISLNLSYDARKAVRIFETRSIPDSLFDETMRQGLRSGMTLRLPHRIRLSGSFGIRFRAGGVANTTSATGGLTVRQIFNTWATFNARLSYFSTLFTKGYNPNINIRFPITRGLVIDVGGGSYIYQTGNRKNYNNWWETGGYYRINRWLFASFGYRSLLGEKLKSGRLFLESGIVF